MIIQSEKLHAVYCKHQNKSKALMSCDYYILNQTYQRKQRTSSIVQQQWEEEWKRILLRISLRSHEIVVSVEGKKCTRLR